MKRQIGVLLLAIILAMTLSVPIFGGSANAASSGITKAKARDIALKNAHLTKAKVRNLDVEADGRSIEVEFVRIANKAEYEYEIAKKDGFILEKSIDYKYKKNKSKSKIGKTKAIKAVAKYTGKSYAVIKKGSCTYSYKKNQGKYKVKFRYGGYKYECEVLAPNGKVVEYEYEYTGTR